MPVPGQIVSSAQRANMLRQVTTTLGRAADEAGAKHNMHLSRLARRDFDLATFSPAQANELQRRVAGATIQIDEGNCFNRAMLGAHLAGRMAGTGTAPADDVLGGALAVRAYTHDGGTYTGAFHTKLAIRVDGRDELQLIDPLPGNPRLQDLSEWAPPSEVRLLRPYQGTGIPFSDGGARAKFVNADGIDFASKMLRASIYAAVPDGGGRVINPSADQLAAAQRRVGL